MGFEKLIPTDGVRDHDVTRRGPAGELDGLCAAHAPTAEQLPGAAISLLVLVNRCCAAAMADDVWSGRGTIGSSNPPCANVPSSSCVERSAPCGWFADRSGALIAI